MKLKKGTFGIFPAQMIRGLPALEQILFCWICSHINNDGVCWPSLKTLSEESGMSRNTVRRLLQSLEERGLIKRKKRKKTDSLENDSTLYEVIIKDVGSDVTHVGQERGNVGSDVTHGVGSERDGNQTQLELNKRTKYPLPPKGDSDFEETFQKMVAFFNEHTQSSLMASPKKREQFRARLKVYTAREIATAIIRRTQLPFYQGKNNENKIWYNDWDSLFRNDEKIEKILNTREVEKHEEVDQNADKPF